MGKHAESAAAADSTKHGTGGVKHLSAAELKDDANSLCKFAEAATPQEMNLIHEALMAAKKGLSAEQYGELLKDIRDKNSADRQANPHLPSLTFFDSTDSGLPDAVRQEWTPASDKK